MTTTRVAIDLRLAAYRTGGIARYGNELAAALQRIDGLDVIGLRSSRDTTRNARKLRTPPHHRFERYSIGVELALARLKPDVYHAVDFICPRVPGVAMVATVHDLEFLRHPEYLDTDALRYYQQLRHSLDWTDGWITPSQWTANDLSASFDIDPRTISVVPHGIPRNLALTPPIPRNERDPFLLAVSTVEPRKRFDLLLDANDILKQPFPIRIAGRPGWNSDDLASRIRRTASVDWRDDVNDSGLWDLYRRAYAVVVPSMSEGFGLSALEAMAAGTPVVSSGKGALPEVTGDAALVPESDDPQAWAAAIERIRDDEHLWNELSLFGQRRARAFSWNHAAQATADVYLQVCGN